MVDSKLKYIVGRSEFDISVLKPTHGVIVDFTASWCPPCKKLGALFEEKIKTSNGWTIIKMDVDNEENKQIATEHQVQGIPAVFLYRKGKKLDQFTGYNPQKLDEFIKKCVEFSATQGELGEGQGQVINFLDEDIEKLSVKQLKQLIQASNLSFQDCIEKSDLQKRANEAKEILKAPKKFKSKLTGIDIVKPSTDHTATLIFMHGLGDTAQGWKSELQRLQKKHFPSVKIILPTAPQQKVTMNGGNSTYSWHDIENLTDLMNLKFTGVEDSQLEIVNIINEEIKSGTPSSKILIGGFSQGAAMTLFTGLQFNQKLAGLICLSGYLPKFMQFSGLISQENKDTKVFVAHGKQDPVVNLQFGQGSAMMLQSLGVPITLKLYDGMGHSTSEKEMSDMVEFIQQVI